MLVRSLQLVDFRCYDSVEVSLAPDLTAVVGANGQGKTNLLEAIGFAAGIGSLRGAKDAALIRDGCASAVIRCEAQLDNDREVLIEAELAHGRANRVQVNRQRLDRRRDLLDLLAVTVFAPDDLELVKGDPAVRRRWIDDALAAVNPAWAPLRSELERILRQRNALLRQAGGRATDDVVMTLDVWDSKLSSVSDELRDRRRWLLTEMAPALSDCYQRVAQDGAAVAASYTSSWGDESLADALAEARSDDLRRAITTVGPHRDDIVVALAGLPARTHASQGEQRSLALAMRLAVHGAVRDRRGVMPVLLLDDVFSELDQGRSAALVRALPPGQKILTTTGALPHGVSAEHTLRVVSGRVTPAEPR